MGFPSRFLIPASIAQIKGGNITEVARITPEELKSRLAAEKK